MIVIITLIIIQIILLISYINKTNKELSRFFVALKDEYASYKIADTFKTRSYHELSQILNETSSMLKKARLKTEKQFQFMQFIFETAPSGMIIADHSGNIKNFNKASIRLLEINDLKHLKQFEKIKHGLSNQLEELPSGKSILTRYTLNNELLIVMISSSHFRMDGKDYKLYVLQDFRNELEDNEIRSWQKLIRVINHEIMNSITPIITLTGAIKKGFDAGTEIPEPENISREVIKDTIINTEIIEERSKGLKEFIEKYRSISRIGQLSIETIELKTFLEQILLLFEQEAKQRSIAIDLEITQSGLTIEADKKLIQQVLINLIRNALEALDRKDQSSIKISAYQADNKNCYIEITDNGPGIPADILGDIFTPFFTTKKDGAGIGLSLSRQIMKQHKGNIFVKSGQGKGTTFILRF